MAKRSLARHSRRKDPSLHRIIAVLVVIVAIAAGVMQVTQWFNREFVGADVAANAPDTLRQASELIEQGAYDRARELLLPLLERLDDANVTPAALMLLAELEEARGNTEAALAHLERAVSEHPGTPHYADAAAGIARLEESLGHTEEAAALYATLAEKAPPGKRAGALMGLARRAEAEGNLERARTLFRRAVDDAPWGEPDWKTAVDELGRLNVALIFSREDTEESKRYTIKPGDNLTAIGNRLNTTQGLLWRANGIEDARNIRPGDTLKYTPKDFRIVIERETFRLYLLDGMGIFKVYPVGLARPGHVTTPGSYTIGDKQKDPTWFPQGRPPVPPDDPNNELGSRWMPLLPAEEGLPRDLGIHGTIDPDSIGKPSSAGCPRMQNADVEELYDLVVRSTPVEIIDRLDPAAYGLAHTPAATG